MATPTNPNIQEMEPNCVVDSILDHKDNHEIYNKLFDRLFGKGVSQWIETRPDSGELYQDLFDKAIAKINARNPNQGQEQEQIALDKEDSTQDTNTSCKYMAPYNSFEPHTPGLGTWVPMFMTEEEVYKIAPAIETLTKNTSDALLAFTRYLNPAYICFRLEKILKLTETGRGLGFPGMNGAAEIVKAWNSAFKNNRKDCLVRTFAAVSCFDCCREFAEELVHNQLLEDPQTVSVDVSSGACTMFAKLDNEQYYASFEDKWRKVKILGANLSILARNFGGWGFLVLFPFFDLETLLGQRLSQFHTYDADLWTVLGDILRSTEMGKFFKSMADNIGQPLINEYSGQVGPAKRELLEQLGTIRLQYSVPKVPEQGPRLEINSKAWKSFPAFVMSCGGLKAMHIAPDLSLVPVSLLQFAGNHIEPEIVEYLIRQQLPHEWVVLGREDIFQPATKELLLCDYQGIIIPLCIDNGWTLFCYTNPIRSETDYFIKFINPTKSNLRHHAALEALSAWIPKEGPWIPRGLDVQLVQPVDSQSATEIDSGIHIIIEAIAMAKTGKPESRPLNEQVCKGLRIKYFSHLLNKLQESANKEAMKRTGETTVAPLDS
ncbi:hypothetical protein F4803DRAFT_573330 [Xylaria telfairii]|nr:hypothetical protein F4803DRAFT_573330 [Xylaria telfairii]